MTRTAAAAMILAAFAAPAAADFNPALDGVPATYTPGTPFSFTVRAGELNDVGLYNVELLFQTVPPAAGLLSATAVPPSDLGQYPFTSTANFLATELVAGNTVSLTITDFSSDPPQGVNTFPFANDTLAIVTVTPGVGLTGPIRLSVNLDTLNWWTTDGGLIPFTPPDGEFVIAQSEPDTGAVPAPAGLVLAFTALAGVAGRGWVRGGKVTA